MASSPPTLIHLLTSNRWGGIERYTLDICRHYKAGGWNLFVVTKDAKAVDNMFEKAGIPLKHAPLEGIYDWKSIRFISNILKETPGPVIIHVHGFRSVFLALAARHLSKKTDTRIIMTRHKVRNAVDNWILRKLYRNIDALIFGSRTARDRFVATWKDEPLPFPASKLHVIHNSINISSPKLSEPETNRPVTMMFHGPIKPGKGLETLIDALVELKGKRIRLRIVGTGMPDYLDKLRRRALSRGVMDLIEWHKHVEDPMQLIIDSDFGVLPSTVEEAFGLANIEFMAAGRPQIASSNGAQPEYITDGWEGFLIHPGNPSFLANIISKLATDPELRQKMGERAVESFNSRLSWPHFISQLEKIYLPD